MYAVVNRFPPNVPPADLRDIIEREFPPVFDTLSGFQGFNVVEAGPSEAIAIMLWDSPKAATAGGHEIGPTLFARHIAPHLAGEQDRVLGEVVVAHVPDNASSEYPRLAARAVLPWTTPGILPSLP